MVYHQENPIFLTSSLRNVWPSWSDWNSFPMDSTSTVNSPCGAVFLIHTMHHVTWRRSKRHFAQCLFSSLSKIPKLLIRIHRLIVFLVVVIHQQTGHILINRDFYSSVYGSFLQHRSWWSWHSFTLTQYLTPHYLHLTSRDLSPNPTKKTHLQQCAPKEITCELQMQTICAVLNVTVVTLKR